MERQLHGIRGPGSHLLCWPFQTLLDMRTSWEGRAAPAFATAVPPQTKPPIQGSAAKLATTADTLLADEGCKLLRKAIGGDCVCHRAQVQRHNMQPEAFSRGH